MKLSTLFWSGAILATACTFGCSKAADKPAPAKPGVADPASAADTPEHTHGSGPNGGVVFDLGSHHAEFTVDHNKHEITVLVLADDEKTPMAVAAKDLMLNTKETKTADGQAVAPMTITLSPTNEADGKATSFVGSDPGVGSVADFAGSVSGEIDGKPAMGEFQE